uniref:T-cell surface glycoprotein CD3 epsilon n=1 Tax=Lutjanus sanguineus TaxID=264213 RepID=A0A0A7CCY4_9TELE|nr:T-cell surface glycoprotein CD3 epsilon [Lutjanus sanguineus]
MTSMGVQAVLAILVLFTATVKAKEGVTFWRENFTMHCPGDGTWYKDNEVVGNGTELELHYENSKKGLYHCQYSPDGTDKNIYFFYVKGKVCENCFELDGLVFLLVIIADVAVTGLLMVTIYKFTKNKSSPGPGHASKAPARSQATSPPVPSPDYEALNSRTRSQDTYSVVNRTG